MLERCARRRRARRPRAARRARDRRRRRAAGTSSRGRTARRSRCGSRTARRGRAGARRRGARSRSPPGRGGRRPCRRADATRRRRGRAPRARPGSSSAAPERSARARRGGRQRATSLELQQSPLVVDAELAPAADPVRGDDPVHGQERGELAAGAERPGRARRARVAGERGQLAVGDDLAARDRSQRACAVGVEARPSSRRSGTSAKSSGAPAKYAISRPARTCPGSDPGTGPLRTRQLAVEDTSVLVEPDLPHAPAGRVVLHERRLHCRCCSFAA